MVVVVVLLGAAGGGVCVGVWACANGAMSASAAAMVVTALCHR